MMRKQKKKQTKRGGNKRDGEADQPNAQLRFDPDSSEYRDIDTSSKSK